MTLVDYARALKQGWAFVAGGLLLCISAALVANIVLPREYTSHLTIYVSGQGAGDAAVAAQQVAQAQVLSFRQLITEDRVLDDVIADLRLVETPTELASHIVVSNDPDTLLLDVAVTDRSPDQAARIANAVAASFARVVAQLDSCSASAIDVPCIRPIGSSFPVVTAQILKKAEPPATAASPLPRLNLALGALVGLVLGAAAAFVRSTRGRRIRSAQHLQEYLHVPNLATFATDPNVHSEPILIPGGDLQQTEELRRLASNLRLIDVSRLRKAIVLTSTRKNAGTTTTACNLAIALAAEGKQVALVDANMRRGGIAELLGVDPTIGLSTVLIGQVPLNRAMQSWGNQVRLDVLTTGDLPPSPGDLLGSVQMSTVITMLRRQYDFVIFDSPPLLTAEDAAVLAAKADGAVLVCQARYTRSKELTSAAEVLAAAGAKLLGTVLTSTRRQRGPNSVPPSNAEPILRRAPVKSTSEEAATIAAPAGGPSPIPPPSGTWVAAAPAPDMPVQSAPQEAPVLLPAPTPRPRPKPTPWPRSAVHPPSSAPRSGRAEDGETVLLGQKGAVGVDARTCNGDSDEARLGGNGVIESGRAVTEVDLGR